MLQEGKQEGLHEMEMVSISKHVSIWKLESGLEKSMRSSNKADIYLNGQTGTIGCSSHYKELTRPRND